MRLGACSREEIINAYDNAILYTDFFLSEVIELLKRNDEEFQDDKNVPARVAVDVVLQAAEHAFVSAFDVANGVRGRNRAAPGQRSLEGRKVQLGPVNEQGRHNAQDQDMQDKGEVPNLRDTFKTVAAADMSESEREVCF